MIRRWVGLHFTRSRRLANGVARMLVFSTDGSQVGDPATFVFPAFQSSLFDGTKVFQHRPGRGHRGGMPSSRIKRKRCRFHANIILRQSGAFYCASRRVAMRDAHSSIKLDQARFVVRCVTSSRTGSVILPRCHAAWRSHFNGEPRKGRKVTPGALQP